MTDRTVQSPSHTRINLGSGHATVNNGVVVIRTDGPLDLDANDALRLAAFLSRFYTEQTQAIARAENAQVRDGQAAKAARYAERNPKEGS